MDLDRGSEVVSHPGVVARRGLHVDCGDAANLGGGSRPPTPIVGIAGAPCGQGYWLVDSAGQVWAFGAAVSTAPQLARHRYNRDRDGRQLPPCGCGWRHLRLRKQYLLRLGSTPTSQIRAPHERL